GEPGTGETSAGEPGAGPGEARAGEPGRGTRETRGRRPGEAGCPRSSGRRAERRGDEASRLKLWPGFPGIRAPGLRTGLRTLLRRATRRVLGHDRRAYRRLDRRPHLG